MVEANERSQHRSLQRSTVESVSFTSKSFLSAKLIIFVSLLAVDVGYYLPHYKSVSVYWMKDLMSKKRKAIKSSEIQTLTVPQYESLSIKRMLDFASAYNELEDYFPDPREIPNLPRSVSKKELGSAVNVVEESC